MKFRPLLSKIGLSNHTSHRLDDSLSLDDHTLLPINYSGKKKKIAIPVHRRGKISKSIVASRAVPFDFSNDEKDGYSASLLLKLSATGSTDPSEESEICNDRSYSENTKKKISYAQHLNFPSKVSFPKGYPRFTKSKRKKKKAECLMPISPIPSHSGITPHLGTDESHGGFFFAPDTPQAVHSQNILDDRSSMGVHKIEDRHDSESEDDEKENKINDDTFGVLRGVRGWMGTDNDAPPPPTSWRIPDEDTEIFDGGRMSNDTEGVTEEYCVKDEDGDGDSHECDEDGDSAMNEIKNYENGDGDEAEEEEHSSSSSYDLPDQDEDHSSSSSYNIPDSFNFKLTNNEEQEEENKFARRPMLYPSDSSESEYENDYDYPVPQPPIPPTPSGFAARLIHNHKERRGFHSSQSRTSTNEINNVPSDEVGFSSGRHVHDFGLGMPSDEGSLGAMAMKQVDAPALPITPDIGNGFIMGTNSIVFPQVVFDNDGKGGTTTSHSVMIRENKDWNENGQVEKKSNPAMTSWSGSMGFLAHVASTSSWENENKNDTLWGTSYEEEQEENSRHHDYAAGKEGSNANDCAQGNYVQGISDTKRNVNVTEIERALGESRVTYQRKVVQNMSRRHTKYISEDIPHGPSDELKNELNKARSNEIVSDEESLSTISHHSSHSIHQLTFDVMTGTARVFKQVVVPNGKGGSGKTVMIPVEVSSLEGEDRRIEKSSWSEGPINSGDSSWENPFHIPRSSLNGQIRSTSNDVGVVVNGNSRSSPFPLQFDNNNKYATSISWDTNAPSAKIFSSSSPSSNPIHAPCHHHNAYNEDSPSEHSSMNGSVGKSIQEQYKRNEEVSIGTNSYSGSEIDRPIHNSRLRLADMLRGSGQAMDMGLIDGLPRIINNEKGDGLPRIITGGRGYYCDDKENYLRENEEEAEDSISPLSISTAGSKEKIRGRNVNAWRDEDRENYNTHGSIDKVVKDYGPTKKDTNVSATMKSGTISASMGLDDVQARIEDLRRCVQSMESGQSKSNNRDMIQKSEIIQQLNMLTKILHVREGSHSKNLLVSNDEAKERSLQASDENFDGSSEKLDERQDSPVKQSERSFSNDKTPMIKNKTKRRNRSKKPKRPPALNLQIVDPSPPSTIQSDNDKIEHKSNEIGTNHSSNGALNSMFSPIPGNEDMMDLFTNAQQGAMCLAAIEQKLVTSFCLKQWKAAIMKEETVIQHPAKSLQQPSTNSQQAHHKENQEHHLSSPSNNSESAFSPVHEPKNLLQDSTNKQIPQHKNGGIEKVLPPRPPTKSPRNILLPTSDEMAKILNAWDSNNSVALTANGSDSVSYQYNIDDKHAAINEKRVSNDENNCNSKIPIAEVPLPKIEKKLSTPTSVGASVGSSHRSKAMKTAFALRRSRSRGSTK